MDLLSRSGGGTLAICKTDATHCKGQRKKEAFGKQLLPHHEANNGEYVGGMRGGGVKKVRLQVILQCNIVSFH